MKRLEFISAIAVVIVGLSVSHSPVHGEVIYESLNEGTSAWAGDSAATTSLWLAQAFNRGTQTELTKVTLDFTGWEENTTANIQLWKMNGDGYPDDPAPTLLGVSSSLNAETTFAGSWDLTEATDWYIVVSPVTGGMNWGWTNSRTVPVPESEFVDRYCEYSVLDSTWTLTTGSPQRMIIEAVPEPSTWVGITFLGVLGVGHFGRRLFARFARN